MNKHIFWPRMRLNDHCLQARGGVEQDVLEAYCWMYSTWNIPKEYKGACSGGDQVTWAHICLFVYLPLHCIMYIYNKIRNFLPKDFGGNELNN